MRDVIGVEENKNSGEDFGGGGVEVGVVKGDFCVKDGADGLVMVGFSLFEDITGAGFDFTKFLADHDLVCDGGEEGKLVRSALVVHHDTLDCVTETAGESFRRERGRVDENWCRPGLDYRVYGRPVAGDCGGTELGWEVCGHGVVVVEREVVGE